MNVLVAKPVLANFAIGRVKVDSGAEAILVVSPAAVEVLRSVVAILEHCVCATELIIVTNNLAWFHIVGCNQINATFGVVLVTAIVIFIHVTNNLASPADGSFA